MRSEFVRYASAGQFEIGKEVLLVGQSYWELTRSDFSKGSGPSWTHACPGPLWVLKCGCPAAAERPANHGDAVAWV